MSGEVSGLGGSPEEFFDDAPCGWVITDVGGTIIKANRAFQRSTGYGAAELLSDVRFQALLAPGGRIYYQTHLEPLIRMQGSVNQVALELVRADGSRMPALVNAALRSDDSGGPQALSIMVFDASERLRYEKALLEAEHREREVAEGLQRGMVGGSLPTGAGFAIEVSYASAVQGLQVGGDWYDSFWLDDSGHTIALVVGDVTGRGLGAATTMGQLRNAVRTLAIDNPGPGPLLDALDLYTRRYGEGQISTVVFAQIELATLEMRFACAGHPPPLIVSVGGQPDYNWGGRSTPLDTYRGDGAGRPEGRLTLEAGSTVLLYTDGLIERRSHPDEDGLGRLRDAVAGLGPRVVGAALGPAAVRALHEPDSADDICMLAFGVSAIDERMTA